MRSQSRHWSRRRLILALAVLLALMVGALLIRGIYNFAWWAYFEVSPYSGDRKIDYRGFYVFEHRGTVNWMNVDGSDEAVAPIYVRFQSHLHKTIYLPAMTEEDAKAMARKTEPPWEDIHGRQVTSYQLDEECSVLFSDGKLVYFGIGPHSGTSFSSSLDGKFLQLPVSLRAIRRMFGEPVKYQWQRKAHT
jgi:hypothetical protein